MVSIVPYLIILLQTIMLLLTSIIPILALYVTILATCRGNILCIILSTIVTFVATILIIVTVLDLLNKMVILAY